MQEVTLTNPIFYFTYACCFLVKYSSLAPLWGPFPPGGASYNL